MPPSPSVSVGTAGTILLIEDYDALAVAFGSTLRRLAPFCETIVVRSLAEGERSAKVAQPDLFVIDVDPPQSGVVDFLNRLKAAHPNARVLVIAPSTWPNLAQERIRRGAFEFIEKPFQIEKFGAIVHALLAPSEPASARSLGDLDLTDMIALFGVAGATTNLTVTATAGTSGEIQFVAGHMTQAMVAGTVGVAALQEMLAWPSPRFSESESRDELPRTIRGSWTSVLQAALRAVQASGFALELAPDAPEESARPRKKVVVIDDTELLLIFVSEILRSTRTLVEVTTAATGLEGVQRVLEVMPNLILLDYSLPDITGDEVCRRLIEDSRTAKIPVLMMSGHVAEMKATAEQYSNVVGTLEKPFLAANLIHVVENLLSGPPEARSSTERQSKSTSRGASKKSALTKTAKVEPKPEPTISTAPAITEVPAPSEPLPPPADSAPAAVPKKNGIELVRPDAPETIEVEPPTPSPTAVPPSEGQAEIETPSVTVATPEESASAEPPPQGSSPEGPLLSENVAPLLDEPIPPAIESRAVLAVIEPAAPARIPDAKDNAVVLAMPLEITSIHFSPALQAKTVRAKPYSTLVFMHILSDSLSPGGLPARTFELDQVDLDLRGQISGVRLTPSDQPVTEITTGSELVVADVVTCPTDGEGTMEVTPSAAQPMRIQLLVLFELVAVELTAELGVEHLILKTRGAKVRLNLRPGATNTGITFQAAQILLDRSARIAEVLLDALA